LQEANEQAAEPPIQIEYMQVKTPFIEKWEKEMEEIFTNSELKSEAFSCWDNHEELISIDFDTASMISKELPIPANNMAKPVVPNIVNIASNTKKPTKKKQKIVQDPPQAKDVYYKIPDNPSLNDECEIGEERKEMHNATEKRRREKINTKINELRDLIPQCKNYGANKAAVLNHTVEYIKQINSNYAQLMSTNRQLQDTNAQLVAELREMHRILWAKAKEQGYEVQMRGIPNIYQPLNPISTNINIR